MSDSDALPRLTGDDCEEFFSALAGAWNGQPESLATYGAYSAAAELADMWVDEQGMPEGLADRFSTTFALPVARVRSLIDRLDSSEGEDAVRALIGALHGFRHFPGPAPVHGSPGDTH